MFQQPVHPVGDIMMIVLGWETPGRGSLKDAQMADLAGDLGHKLKGAGAGTNDRDALAGQVDVVTPLGGVKTGTLETVTPLDLRKSRTIELPHGGDHRAHLDNFSSGWRDKPDPPDRAGLVPGHFLDRGLKPDMATQVIAVGHALEIVEQDRLG